MIWENKEDLIDHKIWKKKWNTTLKSYWMGNFQWEGGARIVKFKFNGPN